MSSNTTVTMQVSGFQYTLTVIPSFIIGPIRLIWPSRFNIINNFIVSIIITGTSFTSDTKKLQINLLFRLDQNSKLLH